MSETLFLDTSALAKLYIEEAGTAEAETLVADAEAVVVSQLALVEFASLVARRQRMGEFDAGHSAALFQAIRNDRAARVFTTLELSSEQADAAIHLLEQHGADGLRSLDALHLAGFLAAAAGIFITADRVQARIAKKLTIEVRTVGR